MVKGKVMRLRSDNFGDPFIQKILQNYFDETAKLCKAFEVDFNQG